MISTIWFLIKIGILAFIAYWLTSLSGSVLINFETYQIDASLNVFIIVSVVIVWIFSILLRALNAIINAPQAIATYNEKRYHKKGLQALAHGFSSVAIGDIRLAKHYTKRTHRYLKNDFGLGNLLQGLTAKLSGDEALAEKSFQSLLLNKETSFLGLKSLLITALDKGDLRYARVLIKKSYEEHPKQEWVLRAYYDLEIKSNNFDNALSILKKMIAYDMISKSDANDNRAILLYLNDDLKKAYKLAPLKLPLALKYLEQLVQDGKRRKSMSIIKTLWKKTPHPKLLDYWIRFAPTKAVNNAHIMAGWIEDLYRLNDNSATSSLYCGEALVGLGQKDNAKRFIKRAIALHPTARAYQLMHQIDPLGHREDNSIDIQMDKCWICTRTGKIYADWQPLSNGQYFNTIQWRYPEIDSNNGLGAGLNISLTPKTPLNNLFQSHLD